MVKTAATILSILIAVMAVPALAAEQTRDIVVQQSFQTIQNPVASNDFKLSVWVDHQNNTYTIGETVTFFFKSNRDCYINLIDIGTSGNVTIIYPNKYDQNNFIKANVTYQVPRTGTFQFTTTGPAGSEMVKAIATLKKINVFNLQGARQAGPFKAFGQTKGVMVAKDIQVTLNQVPTRQWTEYEKLIKIVLPAVSQPLIPPSAATIMPIQPPVTPPYTAFTANFWTDKQHYRIGEPVRFYFKINRNAYVTLMSIGTSGTVRILFPNRYAPNNYCQTGVTYTVPGPSAPEQYIALGPAGTETLRLIAAQNQFSLSQTPYNYGTSPYPVLNKSAAQVSKDIAVIPTQQPAGAYYTESTISVQITP